MQNQEMALKPTAKFELFVQKNGWLIKSHDQECGVVGVASVANEVDGFAQFLQDLTEVYGPMTNRYSDKRIRILTLPGDKCKSVTPEMKAEILDLIEELRGMVQDDKTGQTWEV